MTFIDNHPTARALPLAAMACSLFVCFWARREIRASEQLPNMVIILADDLGYGDVQQFNARSKIPTPHLNTLAREGVRFTDAHSPSAVCTPTRYGLLTGRYCWRTSLKSGVLWGYSRPLIEPDRPTIASLLKRAGYRTGIVGKWHLGLGWQLKDGAESGNAGPQTVDFTKPLTAGPHTAGFDYSYIIPASCDMNPYVYIEDGRVAQQPTQQQPGRGFPDFVRAGKRSPQFSIETALDHLTEKAVAYVKSAATQDQPFLLYFPLTSPHKPCTPAQRFRGKTDLGPYGDFVHQTDWTVGQVVAAIDESGIGDNTVIFFTSDNGSYMFRQGGEARRPLDGKDHVADATVQAYDPSHHRANGPLRGTKADIWEGGHRVPFIVRFKGRFAPGQTSDQTICHTDIFATCAAIAGQQVPSEAGEDSFSLLPLLTGKAEAFDRAPVIHHSVSGMFAIRAGKWKLILGDGSGGRQSPRGRPFRKPYALFDLEADLAESNNTAGAHPDVVEKLEESCQNLRERGRSR